MAVITRVALKLRLGIPSTDTSEDDALDALITQVTALVEKWLGYPLEQSTTTVYLDGTGREWLMLPGKPCTCVTTTGTTTDASTTVSSIPAAAIASIVAGMPVVGTGIPSGATVSSLGATSVVLSSAATADGTAVRLDFGLSIWEDPTGWYGQGDDAFDSDTLLTPGIYALRRDGRGPLAGLSVSGMVQRANGLWLSYPRRQGGLLSSFIPGPVAGQGALKVAFTSGYTSALMPADVQLAVMDVIGLVRASSPDGRLINSTSWDGYSVSYANVEASFLGYIGGTGGAILAPHRRMPL
jgi:hypothetical protein